MAPSLSPGLMPLTPLDDALDSDAAWQSLDDPLALDALLNALPDALVEDLDRIAPGQPQGEQPEEQPASQEDARPSSLTIADMIRAFGPEYLRRHGHTLTAQQDRVLRELIACRTAALGSHEWTCDDCGASCELPNSCGNRHCPTCQETKRQQWARDVAAQLLPIPYQHVMLTLPRPLTRLAIANPNVVYPIMLRMCGEAILRCGRQLFGAQLGLLLVLHTWGQLLNAHIHSHVLLACGGLLLDGSGWITLSRDQIKELLAEVSQVFRRLFLKELRQAHARGELKLLGELSSLESAEAFEQWLDPVRDIPWVIRCPGIWDCRAAADDPEATLRTVRYLARYVNRIAISNSRLLGIEGDQVLLRYKDYRDGNRWKVKAIDGMQFIRRFLKHLLLPRLRHIRRCAFMGARLTSCVGKAGVVAELLRSGRSLGGPGGAGSAGRRCRGSDDGGATDASVPRVPRADALDRLHAAAHGARDPGDAVDCPRAGPAWDRPQAGHASRPGHDGARRGAGSAPGELAG